MYRVTENYYGVLGHLDWNTAEQAIMDYQLCFELGGKPFMTWVD